MVDFSLSKSVDFSEKSMYTTFEKNICSGFAKEDKLMTDNEKELIRLIRENDNPERALITATQTILDFLKQHGSSQAPSVVCPQGQA